MLHRIRFVSAQPDEPYFIWQCHVYLQNFVSLGIPARNCIALFGLDPGERPSNALHALRAHFPDVDIRGYEDTRDDVGRAYPPSIQPHLIARALRDSPELEGAPTFFHDSDIAFRRLPDFERMLREHPRACVLSETVESIGFERLMRNGRKIRAERPEIPESELVDKMCAIVGIDVELVRRNQRGSGGAQYLLQGVGRSYWEKVYDDSVALRRFFDDYFGRLRLQKHPTQLVWTAGMWAYLWNLWLAGLETVVHPEMTFVFGPGRSAARVEAATTIHMTAHGPFDKLEWRDLSPIDAVQRQPFLFDHYPASSIAREYAVMIHAAAGVQPRFDEPPRPARMWRVLAWPTRRQGELWHVDEVQFRFEPGVSTTDHFVSGGATRPFAPISGPVSVEHSSGCRPCFYLGVTLDRAAVPEQIAITQRGGPHRAEIALVQYNLDGARWLTTLVARLDAGTATQLLEVSAGHDTLSG